MNAPFRTLRRQSDRDSVKRQIAAARGLIGWLRQHDADAMPTEEEIEQADALIQRLEQTTEALARLVYAATPAPHFTPPTCESR